MWEWIYRIFRKNSKFDENFEKKINNFKAKHAVKIIEKYYLNYIRKKKINAIREKRIKLYRNKNLNNRNFNNYINTPHYINKINRK